MSVSLFLFCKQIHLYHLLDSTYKLYHQFSLVQFSCLVMSDSSQPHESQHARPPCPSPTPGVYSNPCPSSRWCHPAISSSVVPFSSYPNPSQHQGLFPWVNSSHHRSSQFCIFLSLSLCVSISLCFCVSVSASVSVSLSCLLLVPGSSCISLGAASLPSPLPLLPSFPFLCRRTCSQARHVCLFSVAGEVLWGGGHRRAMWRQVSYKEMWLVQLLWHSLWPACPDTCGGSNIVLPGVRVRPLPGETTKETSKEYRGWNILSHSANTI